MSDTEINIAIAEACGWKYGDTTTSAFGAEMPLKGWKGPNSEVFGHGQFPPDYLHDLNAMHEAERVFNQGQKTTYVYHLQTICGGQQFGDNYFATARQRAEAFLRTIGKWKEETK